MNMNKMSAFGSLPALIIGTLLFSGCSNMGGEVRKDASLTDQTEKLEKTGLNYVGPQYTIGIITLANKTPSKVLGIDAAATDILRTTLEQAGLKPIMLTKDELKQHDEMIGLQQSGIVKTGKKDAAEGMNSIDFRVSGAITSYAELEEGTDILIGKSKTQIVRVGVDYALVDITTGENLAVGSGQGVYSKTNRTALGLGAKSSFDNSLRDGALRDAMSKAVEAMILKLQARPFQSHILLVDGGSIVFKAGTRSKLEPGARFTVYRPGADLIDPETGRSLGKREKRVGEIKLTSNTNENLSEGSVADGSGFMKGDVLRLVK